MKNLSILVLGVLGVVGAGTAAHATPPASILYLNRCVGDCTINGGADDAKAFTSRLAPAGPNTVHEFAWGDSQWNAVVHCVKEIYSPYNILITDVKPDDNTPYNMQIVAGLGGEIGQSQAGGISPNEPCMIPDTNTITFTFANGWGAPNMKILEPAGAPPGGGQIDCNATPTNPTCVDSMQVICGVIGQESAHSFGLDHEFSYVATNKPACSSPMTYLPHCGQQFFRGELARCGEDQNRACMCSDPQNSHLRLLGVLGAGTPITSAPVLSVTSPLPNGTLVKGQPILADASAQRGVRRIDLKVNGYQWSEVDGIAFQSDGQHESVYSVPVPNEVPDGVMDLEVIAKDDIDISTSVKLTVQKGAKCVDATTCLNGQRCDDRGACLWDPAVGNYGDTCTFPQYCTSGLCNGLQGETSICTQSCVLTASDSCPMGSECTESAPGQGLCFPSPPSGGGCCSTSSGAAAQSALLGLGLIAMTLRRRKRAA